MPEKRFTPGQPANSPMTLPQYMAYLRSVEDASDSNLNKDTNNWTVYDDRGTPAVGYGIQVPNYKVGDSVPDATVQKLFKQRAQSSIDTARSSVPGYNNLPSRLQMLAADQIGYQGVKSPKLTDWLTKYRTGKGTLDRVYQGVIKESQTYSDKSKGKLNTRRHNLKLKNFIYPQFKSEKAGTPLSTTTKPTVGNLA